MILMGPFQLEIFYDSMKYGIISLKEKLDVPVVLPAEHCCLWLDGLECQTGQ